MAEEKNKLNLNWSAVEKSLAEGTYSGYKMGILETEKLFKNFLEAKNIPGRTIDAKIKYVSRFFSRSEQLKYSRDMYKKVIDQPHFEISRDETKQVIHGYWQAMLDLAEAIQTISRMQKLNLRLRYYFGLAIKKIRKIAIILAALILLILFFYETGFGKKAAANLGQAVHYLVFRIGPWVIGGALAIFLFWLGMKVLKKKKEF